jgi:hypothetical protein
MLSGVLLIVILIIFILQNTISATNNTMGTQQNAISTTTNVSIMHLYQGGIYNLTVYEATGNINSTTFPCCTWDSNGPFPAGAVTACQNATGTTFNCTTTTSTMGWGNVLCPSRNFDVKNGRCA